MKKSECNLKTIFRHDRNLRGKTIGVNILLREPEWCQSKGGVRSEFFVAVLVSLPCSFELSPGPINLIVFGRIFAENESFYNW